MLHIVNPSYAYDKNGNLTKDLNKKITNISYNSLHLPKQLTINGVVHKYTYAADGRKLKVVQGGTARDYAGSIIYENGSLKRILIEGGYIEGGTYYFYFNDHLGNVRAVASGGGSTVQCNHYYPFGLPMAETTNTAQNTQPYKYNGKEFERKDGLNWMDYGVRNYDAALGRFTTMDPLAEKYYGMSPYAYCGNNPMRFIDPDGRGWDEALPHLKKSFSGNVSFGLRVGAKVNISNMKVGGDINAGSVELGSDGLKLTRGVGLDIGVLGAEIYEETYKADNQHDVKKEGASASFLGISAGLNEITIYDSTGEYYQEVKNETAGEINYTIGASATAGVGIELEVDFKEVWNFIVKLFE